MQSFIFNDFKRRLLAGGVAGNTTWTFQPVNSKFSETFEDKNIETFTNLNMINLFREPGEDETAYVNQFFVNYLPVYYYYKKATDTLNASKPVYVDSDNWESFITQYKGQEHLKDLFFDKRSTCCRLYDTGEVDENGNPIYKPAGFYFVKTVEELKWCADKVNGESDGVIIESFNNYINIVLGDDIGTRVIDDIDFVSLKVINFSIGKYSSRPFEGILFGNGYRFRNLKILCSNNNNGIVGNLGSNGKIMSCKVEGNVILQCNKQITIDHMMSDATDINAGILAGKSNGLVRNCYINSNVHLKGFVPGVYTVSNKTDMSGAFNGDNSNMFYPDYMCINSIANIVPYIGYFNEGVFGTYASGNYNETFEEYGKGYWKSNLIKQGATADNIAINNNYPYDNKGCAEIGYPSAVQINGTTIAETKEKNALKKTTTGHSLYYDYTNIIETENLITDNNDFSDMSISLIPRTGFNSLTPITVKNDSGDIIESSAVASGTYFINANHLMDNPLKLHPFNRVAYNTGIAIGCNNGDINNVAISAAATFWNTYVGFLGGLAGKWNSKGNKISNNFICLTAHDLSMVDRDFYSSDTGDTSATRINDDTVFSIYAPSMYIGENKYGNVTSYVSMCQDNGSEPDSDCWRGTPYKIKLTKGRYKHMVFDDYYRVMPVGKKMNMLSINFTDTSDAEDPENIGTIQQVALYNHETAKKIQKSSDGFTLDSVDLLKKYKYKHNPGTEYKITNINGVGMLYLTNSDRGTPVYDYNISFGIIKEDKDNNNLNIDLNKITNDTYFNEIQVINAYSSSDLDDQNTDSKIVLTDVVFKVESIVHSGDNYYCYPFYRVKEITYIDTNDDDKKKTFDDLILTTCRIGKLTVKKTETKTVIMDDGSEYSYDKYVFDSAEDVVYTLYEPHIDTETAGSTIKADKVYELKLNYPAANKIIQTDSEFLSYNYYTKSVEIMPGNNYHIEKKSIKNVGGSFGRVVLCGDKMSTVHNLTTYLYNADRLKFIQDTNMVCTGYFGDISNVSTNFFAKEKVEGERWILDDEELDRFKDTNCHFYVTGGDPIKCICKGDVASNKSFGASEAFTIKPGMRIALYNGKDLMYYATKFSRPNNHDYTFDNRYGGFAAICDLDSCSISDRELKNTMGANKYINFNSVSAAYDELPQVEVQLKGNISAYYCGPMKAFIYNDTKLNYSARNNKCTIPFGIALPFIAEIKPTCLSIPSIIESPGSNMSINRTYTDDKEYTSLLYGRVGMFTQDQNLAAPTRDPNFWSINYHVDVPGVMNSITYDVYGKTKDVTTCELFNCQYKSNFLDKIFDFYNITFNKITAGVWTDNDMGANPDAQGYGIFNKKIYSFYPSKWEPVRNTKSENEYIYSGYYDSKALAPYQYFGSDLELARYTMEGFSTKQNSETIIPLSGNKIAIGEYYNSLNYMWSDSDVSCNLLASNIKINNLEDYIIYGYNAVITKNIKNNTQNALESDNTWGDNVFTYTYTTGVGEKTEKRFSMKVILDENENGQFGFNFKDAINEYDVSDSVLNTIGKKEKFEEEESKNIPMVDRKVQRIENTYKYFYDQTTAVSASSAGEYTAVYNKPYDGTVMHLGLHLHESCITDLLKVYPTVTASAISANDFDGILVYEEHGSPVMYLDVGLGDCDGTQTWMLPCSGALGTSGVILEVENEC